MKKKPMALRRQTPDAVTGPHEHVPSTAISAMNVPGMEAPLRWTYTLWTYPVWTYLAESCLSQPPYDVTDDVFGIKTLFVNVYFVGAPGPGNAWVLVDAGFRG